MTISKIIHQTWKDLDVPERFKPLINSWKIRHPDWQYILWTDEMNRDFLNKNYPEFLQIYDAYTFNIQRVDAVRYFILYKMGGVFIDLDFRCIKNLEPLLTGHECLFGLEPEEHSKLFTRNKIICNAFMACRSGNEFFRRICDDLKNNAYREAQNEDLGIEVLESTGPFKLTQIYEFYPKQSEIVLLPSHLLYPLTLTESEAMTDMMDAKDLPIQDKINAAFAVHFFWGSWWKENDTGAISQKKKE